MEIPLADESEHNLVVGGYQELRVIHNNPLLQLYTTAVKFDSHEQLFWAGSQSVIKVNFFKHFVVTSDFTF